MSQWTSEMPHQTTSYTPPMSLLSNLTLLDRDDKVDDDVLTYFPVGALPRGERWGIEGVEVFNAIYTRYGMLIN